MKSNRAKNKRYIKVPEDVLLSLVADRLKDRVLFPEKVERLRSYTIIFKKDA
ncbi:MAG TPA: hypothetical protein VL547_16900 [Dinghuibacter sp.]|uniref:hypothetical protein n=1 Tax=Dinghuibacter sp. TaxID=2024697 RepID=UPI002CCD43DF|nr:hypothetical protein [Dinghuibacter sp.]HTJ13719.1 hypothetical protein [Dinghuibacter sp.]